MALLPDLDAIQGGTHKSLKSGLRADDGTDDNDGGFGVLFQQNTPNTLKEKTNNEMSEVPGLAGDDVRPQVSGLPSGSAKQGSPEGLTELLMGTQDAHAPQLKATKATESTVIAGKALPSLYASQSAGRDNLLGTATEDVQTDGAQGKQHLQATTTARQAPLQQGMTNVLSLKGPQASHHPEAKSLASEVPNRPFDPAEKFPALALMVAPQSRTLQAPVSSMPMAVQWQAVLQRKEKIADPATRHFDPVTMTQPTALNHALLPTGHQAPQAVQALHATLSLQSQQWQADLGELVARMQVRGQRLAEVRLDPPDLGPIRIHLTHSGEQTQVLLQAHHPDTRLLLHLTADRLRDSLADSGFGQVQVQVGEDSSKGTFAQERRYDSSDTRTKPSDPLPESTDGLQLQMIMSPGIGQLDLFA